MPVLEKFENGHLTKIVLLPFDKMGSKSAIDLLTRKPPRITAKKLGNFEFAAKMLVYVIEPRSGSFLLSSQGTHSVQCSWLM